VAVVEENRPYLERGDKVFVYAADGARVHYERIVQ
jgi:hypothetical protein